MMTKTISKILTTNNFKAKLPDHVHIFSVEDHDYWKPKLLKSIDQMKADNNIGLNNSGYYYDFDLPKAPRTYETLIDNILLFPVAEICDTYGLRVRHKNKSWFQQYIQGSSFGWHQHDGHWAFIYYVELPDTKEATEFLNYGKFDVKEGDMVTKGQKLGTVGHTGISTGPHLHWGVYVFGTSVDPNLFVNNSI